MCKVTFLDMSVQLILFRLPSPSQPHLFYNFFQLLQRYIISFVFDFGYSMISFTLVILHLFFLQVTQSSPSRTCKQFLSKVYHGLLLHHIQCDGSFELLV